ncbi:MAG: thioredoxin-dependent thiol peroxidase [Sphaerochaetaceae bacterium]|nr:thioredoxin-dependent thiol peroxidase [Sphaerochaetaceae bacterium]
MLETGSHIPDIDVLDQDGNKVNLTSFRGKMIVLYAYPKDNTSGCTTEACSMRDNYQPITQDDTLLFGISCDPPSSHLKFIENNRLNFPLLSDSDHHLLEALGAWGEKSMYGRKYFGVIRSTFVFDREGILIKVWPKVKVKTHGEDVAAFLQTLS